MPRRPSTTNPEIRFAKSIVDYIFRWMGMEFIPGYREMYANRKPTSDAHDLNDSASSRRNSRSPIEKKEPLEMSQQQSEYAHFQSDAPSCDNCGAITVRSGNCYLCHNCGNSIGCS